MKLGMPTLIEYEDLDANITLCRELKLDFIELNMNMPPFNPERLEAGEIARTSGEHGIGFTLHLPEEIDLGSIHPSVRRGQVERCLEAIRWASEAGIHTVNMHLNPGVYFTLPDRKVWINERYAQLFKQTVVESFTEIDALAGRLNVAVCVENTRNFQMPFISDTLDALMDFDAFALTWDAGHDGRGGFQEQPYFQRNEARLKHMHLHDCNGSSDHQPLYSGIVPIEERLRLAEALDLSVVIEVKTSGSLRESILRLRANRSE